MRLRNKPVIVFLCVENSCRSQIAEAFGRAFFADQYEVASAGSEPSGSVNATAIELMQELGYDMTCHRSKGVDELETKEILALITMGCGDACPKIAAKQRLEWQIPDPKNMSRRDFRAVINLIKKQVLGLVNELSSPT